MPRGGTPLLDATGRVITKASIREEQRKTLRKRPEVITVVTITDGQENQSHEFSRADVLRLVKDKERVAGRSCSSAPGSTPTARPGGMGYDARSTQAYAPDGTGARAAFATLSAAMVQKRGHVRRGETHDHLDFFEGKKNAEDDRRGRHG